MKRQKSRADDRLIHFSSALRMFRRARYVKKHGFKRFGSKYDEIIHNILKNNFNGTYFEASAGHFCEFWLRDFSWCTPALINLGYGKQVESTVNYALRIFKKYNRITTTISVKNIPYDYPIEAPDSLAYFIRTLSIADKKLKTRFIKKNKDFLNYHIQRYFFKFVDAETGLIRLDMHVSSMKDHSIRSSSCYDNCMIGMLAEILDKIDILDNPFTPYNYESLIKKYFWTGSYFKDDLFKHNFPSGDANLYPFWTGVIKDKSLLKKSIKAIEKNHLDRPYPLRYTSERITFIQMIRDASFATHYELDTCWMHMAPFYIELLYSVNKSKARKMIEDLIRLIEFYGTYLEVLSQKGIPYESFFYVSDEGMIWGAMFLDIVQRLKLHKYKH